MIPLKLFNLIIITVIIYQVDSQIWKTPKYLKNFSWFRLPRMVTTDTTSVPNDTPAVSTKQDIDNIVPSVSIPQQLSTNSIIYNNSSPSLSSTITTIKQIIETTTKQPVTAKKSTPIKIKSSNVRSQSNHDKNMTTQKLTTITPKTTIKQQYTTNLISTTSETIVTEYHQGPTTATTDETFTTLDSKDNARVNENHNLPIKREKPQMKIAANISQNLLPLPDGAGTALVKPTKYHYYPHNQHIYLLPECAIQQVCNAIYVRLNWTQPLCACPSRYRAPCSASLNSDDLHTTELITNPNIKKALTLVKTCEPTAEMKLCRTPKDWSLLALQNIRTGKSHYLVICRCPDSSILEGPMSHDQPTYASVPGIRVYGMMCVQSDLIRRKGRPLRYKKSLPEDDDPRFPWEKAIELSKTALWD